MPEPTGETVVARLRPHGRAMFWPCVVLVVVAGGVSFLESVLREPWQQIAVLVIAGLVVLFGWFVPLCSWLSRHYTITTRRIVVRTGILRRSRQELLLARATDVTVTKSAGQAMFGSGDVRVNASRETSVVLRDVPSANLVQQTLHDLMERNLPEKSFG